MDYENRKDKAFTPEGEQPALEMQLGKVRVELRAEGLFFCYENREVGPFKYRVEMERKGFEMDVAAILSGIPEDRVIQLKVLIEKAVDLTWHGQKDEAMPLDWEIDSELEKWAVRPRDVLAAKLRLRDHIPYELPQIFEDEEGVIHTQISRLDAALAGKPVVLNGQIVSEQSQKALPESLYVRCSRCNAEIKMNLAKPENRDLLEAVIFNQKKILDMRAKAALIQEESRECSGRGGHSVECEEQGFIDYAVLGVRDLLEEMEKFDQQVYQARRVHLVGVKVPPSKKVRFRGQVVVDPSSRDLCVLADEAEALGTQVAGFQVTDEDRAEWPKWFNSQLDVAAQVAPDMVGRELVQRAYLLVIHSVPEIPDIHGEKIRGSLRVLCFGDTKTHKSESAKDLTIGHYGLGGFIVAESSSRTGITYSVDTENKAIVWGELPNNDLGLTVIDGLHTMFGEEMKELRESLENQRIIVRRFVSGEALARTRVIGILNPNKPMNQYMYPCMAVKDNQAFRDPPDVTRWDLFLPFSDDDVPKETIAARKPRVRPMPDETFKRHVYWAWSRRPEHIQYTDEARSRIVEATTELMANYTLSSLPLVHNGIRDVLSRLSVAQACRTHSTDETHTLVIIDVGHVEAALQFYHEMLDRLALGAYKLREEGRLEIRPSELEEIVGDLNQTHMEILRSIEIQSKGSPALAAELDLSDRTIKEYYKALKKHGLIATSPKVGVELTARGVQFLKALTQTNGEIVKKNFTISLIPEGKGISIKDLIQRLRAKWTRGYEQDFEDLIVELGGYTKQEAERLREKLLEEGALAYDPEGYLVWVR